MAAAKKKDDKKSNRCRIPGHDHDWTDCPNNWKNQKKGKSKGKQENKHIHKNTEVENE